MELSMIFCGGQGHVRAAGDYGVAGLAAERG